MWLGWSYTLANGRDRTLTRRATRAFEVLMNFSTAPQDVLFKRYDEFVDATPEGNLIHIFRPSGPVALSENLHRATCLSLAETTAHR